jgi:drug/metabolite transporter (DMT)-like permease
VTRPHRAFAFFNSERASTASEVEHRRLHFAAAVAAAVTVFLWASAFVGIRSAGRSFSPGALSLGRLGLAALFLGTLAGLRGERLPTREAFARVAPALVVCAVMWFGVYNVALNAGERRVDAGTAAILVNVGPVMVAILAGFVLREGFPAALFAGSAIAFAGILVIALGTTDHAATTAGVLLCLVAAASYATGAVTQKLVLGSLTGAQTILLCCVIGTVSCLPFASQLGREIANAPAGAIGWLIYLAVAPTALGFSTWAFALRHTEAGRLAATTYLVPPLSIVLSWLWLGEIPTALAYLGGALCLIGVGLSRRR